MKRINWINLAILLLLGAGIAVSQTQLWAPALPIRTFLSGVDNNNIARPMIGIDASGNIELDPDAIGSSFGGALTVDGALTQTGAITASSTLNGNAVPTDTGAFVISTLATNDVDVANSIWLTSNDITLEGATADGFEGVITPQDFAADRAITLVDAAGPLNIGYTVDVLFCGQQANNGTNYMSPVNGFGSGAIYDYGLATDDWSIGGDGCDTEDNATEATADEVMFANNALKVLGLYCEVSSSGSNGVTLNLRDDTADLTPDVTVTIPTSETTAATVTTTTTDIAAGSAVALQVVNTEDLSAQDAWCMAKFLVVP